MFAAQHAIAQDRAQGGYLTYRCAVLGDREACPAHTAPSPVRIEERLELGSIAKYYVHMGMDRDAAIEKAAAVGEFPTRRLVRVTTRELSDSEKHARFVHGSGQSEVNEEVIAESVERPRAAAAKVSAGG